MDPSMGGSQKTKKKLMLNNNTTSVSKDPTLNRRFFDGSATNSLENFGKLGTRSYDKIKGTGGNTSAVSSK